MQRSVAGGGSGRRKRPLPPSSSSSSPPPARRRRCSPPAEEGETVTQRRQRAVASLVRERLHAKVLVLLTFVVHRTGFGNDSPSTECLLGTPFSDMSRIFAHLTLSCIDQRIGRASFLAAITASKEETKVVKRAAFELMGILREPPVDVHVPGVLSGQEEKGASPLWFKSVTDYWRTGSRLDGFPSSASSPPRPSSPSGEQAPPPPPPPPTTEPAESSSVACLLCIEGYPSGSPALLRICDTCPDSLVCPACFHKLSSRACLLREGVGLGQVRVSRNDGSDVVAVRAPLGVRGPCPLCRKSLDFGALFCTPVSPRPGDGGPVFRWHCRACSEVIDVPVSPTSGKGRVKMQRHVVACRGQLLKCNLGNCRALCGPTVAGFDGDGESDAAPWHVHARSGRCRSYRCPKGVCNVPEASTFGFRGEAVRHARTHRLLGHLLTRLEGVVAQILTYLGELDRVSDADEPPSVVSRLNHMGEIFLSRIRLVREVCGTGEGLGQGGVWHRVSSG
jgi:hypothetical protein